MANPSTNTIYVAINTDVLMRATELEQTLIKSYLTDLANALRKADETSREIRAVLQQYCKEGENVLYQMV